MSQKIDGGIPAAPQLRSVATSTKAAPVGEPRAQAIQAGDSLRLTDEASTLQAMQRKLSAAPAIDESRVQAVREALENGTYRINPDVIASRMLGLDELLAG